MLLATLLSSSLAAAPAPYLALDVGGQLEFSPARAAPLVGLSARWPLTPALGVESTVWGWSVSGAETEPARSRLMVAVAPSLLLATGERLGVRAALGPTLVWSSDARGGGEVGWGALLAADLLAGTRRRTVHFGIGPRLSWTSSVGVVVGLAGSVAYSFR